MHAHNRFYSFVDDVFWYASPRVNEVLLQVASVAIFELRRSYLKANKVNKSEGTRKVE